MKVPLGNIYFMLSYAWDALEETELVGVEPDEASDLPSLLARVLNAGTAHAMRRGADRGYVPQDHLTQRLRGRIDFQATARTGSLASGRLWCRMGELSHDVIHNQILKSTLLSLSESEEVSHELRRESRRLASGLAGVHPITVTSQLFRRVRLDRNRRFYLFLMSVCRLIHDGQLFERRSRGRALFRDFFRDPGRLWHLFQTFVRRFYEHHLAGSYSVVSPRLSWGATATGADLGYLPGMQTDMVLHCPERTIIIDTKFYADPLSRRFGRATLHSDHLFQLYSYLRSYLTGRGVRAEGILLYPRVDEQLDLRYQIDGFSVRARTLDLNATRGSISADLLSLARGSAA